MVLDVEPDRGVVRGAVFARHRSGRVDRRQTASAQNPVRSSVVAGRVPGLPSAAALKQHDRNRCDPAASAAIRRDEDRLEVSGKESRQLGPVQMIRVEMEAWFAHPQRKIAVPDPGK